MNAPDSTLFYFLSLTIRKGENIMRKNLLLNVLAIGAVAVGLASCGGNSGSK